ncbi:MAG: DNA polymerase I [Deltaproteobacteria bacterium]|jgi:DNA polymerase I|nr:DNA polymerase I [Deltaproteobacteria bacterium]
MSKKRLYLVDGANYVFRAYYAIRNLSNSKGFPTNALYGFAQMLLKLMKEERPDYIAVCFDRSEPTFRDEIYSEYKANRDEPPDDLKLQFPYVQPLTTALGLKAIDKVGFEADDIIGTLAKRYASEGVDVVIVSGDKDLMQLVDSNVSILDEMKGKRIGQKEVIEKFGVGPEGVTEVLGLAGDTSDNIPGVPGVGMKTAAKLIREYGTLEAVIDNADRITGAVGRKIKENVEKARLSHQLVKIDMDVPVKVALEELLPGELGASGGSELFKELGFTKILSEVVKRPVESAISFESYRLITEETTLKKVLKSINNKDILSIDLETTSLDSMQAEIVGFALSWEAGEAAYIPVGHKSSDNDGGESAGPLFATPKEVDQLPFDLVKEALLPVLSNKKIKKIGQNLNYDFTILKRYGFELDPISFDTMLASYLLNPTEKHGLDSMSLRCLGHQTIKYDEVAGKGKSQVNFSEVSPDNAFEYACEDADVALRLAEIFKPQIDKYFSDLYYKMELPLLEVLVDMQIAGMKIDQSQLKTLDNEFTKRLLDLEKAIYDAAGEEFKINSPKQLGVVLFEKLGLPGGKKTKTGFSTSQDILEGLADDHDLPKLVLNYRTLSKLKSTYVDSLQSLINPNTKRVHTSFNQARTATGRLSSSDPNLQNIPARSEEGRRIRYAFIAEEGNLLLSADYSQIELRVLAHMSNETNLVDAFSKGLDVHAITAAGIFGCKVRDVTKEQRAVGKTVNFSVIYGQTSYGLSRQLGIAPGEAAEYIENYFKKYPGVAKYRDKVLEEARSRGFVETLFGRRRPVTDINSSNKQLQQFAERTAFNTVFQGTAADIIKVAMISIHNGLSKVSQGSKMILQVHDELVFEIPKDDIGAVQKFVVEEMESPVKLSVPLVVDVGVANNWADAH